MWPVLSLLLLSVFHSQAHFNLFITQEEIMKLLGIDAELFYVRDGVVNSYALTFVVMVPANISELHFSWQTLRGKPLPYVLSLHYNSNGAMLPPQMNISSTGVIPTSAETFRITLLCNGLKSAETEVLLQLNVTTDSNVFNETSLNLRRKKICLKGVFPPPRNDTIRLDPENLASVGSLYVAVACAIAMITAVVVTASAFCFKTKKLRPQEPHYLSAGPYDNSQHVFVRLGSTIGRTPSGSGSYATIASIHKSPPSPISNAIPTPYATSDSFRVSYYASSQIVAAAQIALEDPRLTNPADRVRALSVASTTIALEELLQEGTFSRIYRGKYRQKERVLVKTVTEAASKLQISLLLSDGTMMFTLKHKHILPILALNVENSRQPMLLYPYPNKGNLKRFLIKCRQREDSHISLSTQNLVDMAIQVALGCMYLHSQLICYKDLATRNCVVEDGFQVKIADNSLARDLFPSDYACLGDNENRPIKWLALESLLHKQFSGASDVWSFGVLLWELVTLAQQPYAEIDPFEMATYLQNGIRLRQPVNCPDELYTVMNCCWLMNPLERPTFPQVLSYLRDFYTTLGKYI